MNSKIISLLVALSFVLSGLALAAGAKMYQITGTVVEVKGTMVAIQKGGERWEIDLDPTVKGTADLKIGSPITITYVMSGMKLETPDASTTKATTSSGAALTTDAQKKDQTQSSPSPAPTR